MVKTCKTSAFGDEAPWRWQLQYLPKHWMILNIWRGSSPKAKVVHWTPAAETFGQEQLKPYVSDFSKEMPRPVIQVCQPWLNWGIGQWKVNAEIFTENPGLCFGTQNSPWTIFSNFDPSIVERHTQRLDSLRIKAEILIYCKDTIKSLVISRLDMPHFRS
jgi:hypothetical protein